MQQEVTIREHGAPLTGNPFKGWVIWGKEASFRSNTQPWSMLFARISWAEVEPRKGQFAWEAFEKRWNFDLVTGNQRIILRVVLDNPNQHPPGMTMDIPHWLYQAIEEKGTLYNVKEIGQGFSPDYTHPTLIREHRRFLKALGERYNNDHRIAFVQAGSLGHWGEWHTWPAGTGEFPPYKTAEKYLEHYLEAFPGRFILARRPLAIHERFPRLGLYNDVIGDGSQWGTPQWLDWIENGYTSAVDGGVHPPLRKGWWSNTCSGGEFSQHAKGIGHWLTGTNFIETKRQIRRSHTSWIGPHSPGMMTDSLHYQDKLNQLLLIMGYRFVINDVVLPDRVSRKQPLQISFTVENKGVAPFYYRWPVELSLIGSGDILLFRQPEVDITSWVPGKHRVSGRILFPGDLKPGRYSVALAILDEQGRPAVDFAISPGLKRKDGRFRIATVTVTE